MTRLLAYLLRHSLPQVGPDGFIDLTTVQEASKLSREDILSIVTSDPKQRYEIKGDLIRACQGHTLPQVDTSKIAQPITEWDSAILVKHNTNLKLLDSIKEQGLQPMKRRHVHFGTHEEMLRKCCNLTLVFDLKQWLADGHQAYMSTNGVVLVDTVVPYSYLAPL